MKNEYYRDVIDILLKRGEDGVKVKNLALHVYNRHYGLFAHNVVFEEIYNQIRFYLCHQVHRPHSPFMRTRWGHYTIKPDFAIQLDFTLELLKEEPPVKEVKERQTLNVVQLTLF